MGAENEVEEYIRRRFENTIESIRKILKEDLDLPNHLSGIKRPYLRLSFRNTNDLVSVRKFLLPIAIKNGETYRNEAFTTPSFGVDEHDFDRSEQGTLSKIVGLREHDIPYHLRVAIDLDIRVGLWYTITVHGPTTSIVRVTNKDVRPDLVVLAFDIETSKMPLKFPDANQDHIMMISYMINGRGFLIINRDIVSQDIEDFEYSPTPDFPGQFTVYNVADEQALLNKFFTHIQLVRPQVFATYNGDFFDWPFIETRAASYGINMRDVIGIGRNSQDEYCGTYCAHMDCFSWVKRDSYLPAGSHGLKAVCAIKLGYDPLELDPEMMTPLASQDPQTLANYSVSDAVATYYLYMKYVHPFIFSLCNIIPLQPDEVLRKGTGTLCETLLMAQAYKANVIIPNKHEEPKERFYKGHLLDSETYIGGHVEALEAGVYRSDFSYKFKVDPATIYRLIDELEHALRFFLEHEAKMELSKVTNYETVYGEIKTMLLKLTENSLIHDRPLIYHLDVGSMYPNIILTNRLQPFAMVDESICAVCDFNRPGKQCQRKMTWSWRGEFFSGKQNEYKMIKRQLESERFPSKHAKGGTIPYHELGPTEQTALLKKRLADYSQKIYKRTRQHEVVQKTAIVCQRENAFYIDTVRSFRDRRYDYKNLHKVWKKKLDEAQVAEDIVHIEEATKMLVLYDSLQLAHKCILNSFYGYVMRKAARWYSMEMGGIVCETGATIITLARQLIEQFGRPLELDTDGIWCMLPSGFPQNFVFEMKNGKKVSFAYPCVMLNHLLFDRFTNHQYQTLFPDRTYSISSENSIFFEIDGPYRAMVLPSSIEEGKQLKKRYAVFNEDGTMAELKGFEIKRRGELQLIKIFQSQIFKTFLKGENLADCYKEVALVANYWLDVLYSRGQSMEDYELIELISENRSMSRSLEDYGTQKSTSIATAKRLAEFLGDAMVKDRGLACKFIISARPIGSPITSRAIPVAIFSAAPEIRRHFLAKWLKDSNLANADIRDIIDWDYYLERIGSIIQKLIVIPAAMQNVPNPVPRVIPPNWLKKKGTGSGLESNRKEQTKITDIFKVRPKHEQVSSGGLVTIDIEDIKLGTRNSSKRAPDPSVNLRLSLVDLMNTLPDVNFDTDYSAWVASRKPFWLQLTSVLTTKKDGKKPTVFRIHDRDHINIRRIPWEIISVQSSRVVGEFKVWAMLGGVIRSFRLVCPRRIYISTHNETENIGKRVHFRLPDGSSAQYLYEVLMPEKIYQDEFVPSLASLVDTNVDGIWESGIPAEFHIAVKMGALVAMSKETCKNISEAFTLEEFDFKTTKEVPYLTDSRLVYLFFGILSSDSRHILMLTFSNSSILRIFVVDDGMRRQLTALKVLASQTLKNLDSYPVLNSPFSYLEDEMEFEVDYFPSIDLAQRSVQRLINSYLDDRPPPTVALVLKPSDLIDELSIAACLPIIPVTSWLGQFVFPPLDWQRSATRRLLEYYFQLNGWLDRRLALSRYAHVPIGNLPDDIMIYITDVFYARMLRMQGYLLPWNDKGDDHLKSKANTMDIAPRQRQPTINTPGLYRHVIVDLDLSAMAINALLEHTHLILDFETVPPTFTLLKTLLTNWLREAVHGNQFAAQLVESIFRWIRSGSSLIVPRSIFSHLQRLMDRARSQLHSFVRQLGCTVVHGDNHRLLLSTTKDYIDNAKAFIEYLLAELKRTDGLAWITIKPSVYWQTLLWMDLSNYAGFICSESKEEMTRNNAANLRFNLADYLPPILHKPFAILIAEYLDQARNLSGDIPTNINDTVITEIIGDPSSLISEEDQRDETTVGTICPEYRTKFLFIIREIQKIFSSAPASEEEVLRRSFPIRVGSHLESLGEGPVAFVKFIGTVLALDRVASHSVFKLIKHAYALLGIGEFGNSTIFIDPCKSYVLRDVICIACNHCRDLDFCRDVDILAVLGKSDIFCPNCDHPYDIIALENEIIRDLQDEIGRFQEQDLICLRCKNVKADSMTPICTCSGKYRLDIPREPLQDKIKVLNRIAQSFNLSSLLIFLDAIK